MPRKYVRRTDRGLRYTREQLLEAIEKVKSGEYNGYQAAVLYNIPRTTLNDRVTGKHGVKSQNMGKPPILPRSFEKTLADNLKVLQHHGFELTSKEVLELVGSYVKTNKIKIPSKSGVPGIDWLSGFKKRHNFTIKPLHVQFGSKHKDVILVKEFYSLLESKINEMVLADKPQHIWHVEEHSFSEGKRVANTNREKDFTIVTACNAKGEKAPLLTVFGGKESREWLLGQHINVSHKEGICREVLKNYFTTILNYTDNSHPNLIIYDGQSSHIDIGLVDDARKAKVTLIKSPDLDDLDLSITRTLKLKWRAEAETFAGTSKEFANVVAYVFDSTEVLEIEEGFRNAGVYPFATVCDNKFNSDRLKAYEDYKGLKTIHELSKARSEEVEGGSENQTGHTASEVEAIFVPGTESPKTRRRNKITRIAVRRGLTIKEDSEEYQLTKDEEDRLITWITHLDDAGFSITEDKIADAVYDLVTNSEGKMPNRDWYEGFLKRHPEVDDIISKLRPNESVEVWYDRVKNNLKKDLGEVLNCPVSVFNCKEVALNLNPEDNLKKYEIATIEDLTVYLTASAAGRMLPPIVIFPIKAGFTQQNGFSRSMSTWTRAEFFNDYISDVFYPWLIEKQATFPVILFLDHTAHMNLSVTELCKEKQIILMASPNNIQPLELVFREFKLYWKEQGVVMANLGKDEIAKELENYFKKDFGIKIRRGFLDCGFPHNFCKY